ncbi:MAG: LLM class flavin-dependent oxidoreductase [Actinomycetes bacterium]
MEHGNGSVEISWFAALCDDDFEYLGQIDPTLQSSWDHCRDIALTAQAGGFDNILLPSGYQLGIDVTAFASGIAPMLDRMHVLAAVRAGELWPPQLARQLASLDQMIGGRLTVNIISSNIPGQDLDGPERYARTLAVMTIIRELLDGRAVSHHDQYFDFDIDPPTISTVSGTCPPLYFGGLSHEAREVAAQSADVYLMWPDRMENVIELIADMRKRAANYGRTLRFGYRSHVIVRESEAAARDEAVRLLSRLDPDEGENIRLRSLDANSVGVTRQTELRDSADSDGFVEENLWTGIGRARSGCGAAIVGDPDQVVRKIGAYQALGIEAFIFSGYPHDSQARRVSLDVLPALNHAPLKPRMI